MIAEHLPRYERQPRPDIASVNEAAAQQALAVLRKWLGPGEVRRGKYSAVKGWAEVETGRGGFSLDADSYSWSSGWQDFVGMVAKLDGCRPNEAKRKLAAFLGISGEADYDLLRQAAERVGRIEKEKAAKNAAAMGLGLGTIVPASVPLGHPRAAPARAYLRGRPLARDRLLFGGDGLPDDILFSADAFPDFKRPESPLALIALCRSAARATPRAIHRIMIYGDGRPCYSLPKPGRLVGDVLLPGKPSRKQKFSLGSTLGLAALTCGDADPQGRWGVAEGIEDAWAARILKRVPVWSSIASGNMHNVTPPAWARLITIFADNDPSGVGLAEARKAAAIWQALPQVEDVEILTAKHGKDVAAELEYCAGKVG